MRDPRINPQTGDIVRYLVGGHEGSFVVQWADDCEVEFDAMICGSVCGSGRVSVLAWGLMHHAAAADEPCLGWRLHDGTEGSP